ncbi:hypothetical protein E2C01_044794 [Portunus trituberculatus]|uniref:Uncharacterized protein n=1 Tax=Portunus trituberculatus TaxID=210409 RepID=A0A5B7G0G0_PORTR|nr:hypothetical protein [Portunus trituberculatus]
MPHPFVSVALAARGCLIPSCQCHFVALLG